MQVLKKVLFCGLCGIITHIPWVGIGATIFHEYVDDMWDISADKAETEKMKKIASIVTTKLSSINAREVAAETLALNFVKLRSEEILTINKTDEQNNSKIKNIFNLFIKKLSISNTPKITVIGIKEDVESITKLALLDAALIIKYLYDNHERIIASSNEFIQEINNTIILKELVKIQSGIEQNQFMALQYDLYNQIECKISPVNIKEIRDKAAIGQWEDMRWYPLSRQIF
ncbi:hypothetical protein [Rickettsia endosymbiont of Polydrusus tereticollis]|uniref:hypothetical protein n=1 Tax=Rickettsia endosymbiont of Polydrusus tereticollis TaxID=3066251 RepID=UPI003132D46F